MIKNDFSIHLMKNERKSDAIHELKKTLLSNDGNALLYKNYAAILAKSGLTNFFTYKLTSIEEIIIVLCN